MRKYSGHLITIALLLLLLTAKYFAASSKVAVSDYVDENGLQLHSFVLHADTSLKSIPAKDIFARTRNITTEKSAVNRFGSATQAHSIKNNSVQREKESKVDESLQGVVDNSELHRIRLLGIVFHDNKKKAYVALDSQRVIADIGDLVYGRYMLRNIAVNSAELVDTKDNQQKIIFVSGK